MPLTVLQSGSQELDWPSSWAQYYAFRNRWGMTDGTTLRALALGWLVEREMGLRLYIISGYRSSAEQEALYQQAERGQRPYPVAAPGTSYHETGQAFDVGGDRELSSAEWGDIHNLAARYGLSGVAGDPPHFQFTGV